VQPLRIGVNFVESIALDARQFTPSAGANAPSMAASGANFIYSNAPRSSSIPQVK
jgi:hypothetical protein